MTHAAPNKENDTHILPVDDSVVQMGNATPVDPNGFTEDEKVFLKDLQSKLQTQALDAYKPSSLINQSVYADLDQAKRGLADMTSVNLCSKIRQIQDLMQVNSIEDFLSHPTYQAKHLIMDLKYQKELFESQYGDIFII